MKLGVAINVFDGSELMERAIRSYHPVAFHIVVVCQVISNFGEYDNSSAVEAMRLQELGLVDAVILYEPQTKAGHNNEVKKRNLGLDACARAGCSHHITADVDEFYATEELKRAKELVLKGDYDGSACKMLTYYKSGDWVLDPPEEYFVPLIYKIDGRRFKVGTKMAVIADPTRKLETRRLLVFERKQIEMHHFSYVRKDIRKKFANSSANVNMKETRRQKIVDAYENWVPGEKVLLTGNDDRWSRVRRVENKFNIGSNGNQDPDL